MSDARESSNSTTTLSSGKKSLLEAGKNSGIKDGQGKISSPSLGQGSDIQPAHPKRKAAYRATKSYQSHLARASGVSKNIREERRQRKNANGGSTTRTRSQNATKFFESNTSGNPKPFRVYAQS
ncbi:hypothetical protein MMC15_008186 [Xylographa vitiligo]|nr:hypothetical protein [Xylographa vitiligo]